MKCLSNDGKPILVFNKCCCFSLRTGVLIIASLEIFFEILVLLLYITLVSTGLQFEDNEDKEEGIKVTNATASPDQPILTRIERRVNPTDIDQGLRLLLHEVVAMTVSCILIYGVKKNRIGLMKIWMWVSAIDLVDNMIDHVSISHHFQTFLFMLCTVMPSTVAAILVVRSYIIQLTTNDSFVQLEEVHEEV